MLNYLNKLVTKYNKNADIENMEIELTNIENIKKINNNNCFILNLYIYKVDNKLTNNKIENYKKEKEDEITINIFIKETSQTIYEEFINDFNNCLIENIFQNYIVFLIFVNFKQLPEGLKSSQELLFNNVFLVKDQ